MGRHRLNRRAIRKHRNYTTEEAARALGVAKGSVRRWMKAGLLHLVDQRPFLILGRDLIDFLAERDKPKRRCALHELFCFRCHEPKSAAAGMIDFTHFTTKVGTISGLCETCETMMHKKFSTSKLALLCQIADVSFPQGDPRLGNSGNPGSSDHLDKEGLT